MIKPTRLSDAAELNAFVAEHEVALVEFYTEGCSMCAAMEPVLGNVARAMQAKRASPNERAASESESSERRAGATRESASPEQATDVAVGLANPRDDPPLVERFDVRSVPLLLLFREGELVARRAEGFQGAEEVVGFLESNAPVTVA